MKQILKRWLEFYMTFMGFMLWEKGGGSQPSSSTIQQNTIAPEASPYYNTLLGQASGLTDITQNPYVNYEGERTAGFAPMQQGAFNQLQDAQLPQQTMDASNSAYNLIGQTQQASQYAPTAVNNPYAGQQWSNYGLSSLANVNAPLAQAYYAQAPQSYAAQGQGAEGQALTSSYDPQLQSYLADYAQSNAAQGQGAEGAYDPNLQNYYSQAATGQYNPQLQNFSAQAAQTAAAQTGYNPALQNYNAQAAQTGYNPNLQNYQMQGPGNVQSTQAQAAQLSGAPSMNAATSQMYQMGIAPLLQGAQFQGPGNVNAQQVGAERVNAPQLNNLNMQSAQAAYNPNSLQQYQMGPAQQISGRDVTAQNAQAATSSYDPRAALNQYLMGPASQVNTGQFTDPAMAQSYMSPYVQNALNPTLDLMQRQSDIRQRGLSSQAQQAGAFGGYRQGLQLAEEQKNTQKNIGDVSAQGMQQAYQNAQQMYGTDSARALQAAQANQQAGLTVGQQNLGAALQTQQLGAGIGAQYGLASLSNQQQTALSNQAAQLQAQGMTAQQAMQAAQANQAAGLTVGQQNLGAQLQTQQLGQSIGAQYGLASLGNQQQANTQNLSAGLQTQGLQAQTGLQAQQLNQQTGLQAGLANQQTGLQAGLANQQVGYNVNAQNAQLAQQAGLANQAMAGQFGMQQGQFGQQTNLANQQANQTAAAANQSMAGQYGLQQGQFGQQAGLANQQAAMQAALANQQTGLNVGQQNLGAQLQTQGLGTQIGWNAASANQQAQQQAALANQSAGLGVQQLGTQTGMQTALANQQAQQQAYLANQQAAQQTGLANQAGQYQTQQLGTQTGMQSYLQNLANQQQTGLANQQAGLGVQALGAGIGSQFGLANLSNQQQMNLSNLGNQQQSNLANQQAAQQAALANQQSQLSTQQLGAGIGTQFGLANLANQQQFGLANLGNQQQMNLTNVGNLQQTGLANQQAGLQTGLANQQAMMAAQQLGSSQNMQAQLANQQTGLAGQSMGLQQNLAANQFGLSNAQNFSNAALQAAAQSEASRQYGAGLGLQGLNASLGATQMLGGLGQQQFAQQLGLNQAQQLAGAQQQALYQQQLGNQYQDFLAQQNWPYKNLGFMSDVIGRPLTNASTSTYAAPPSTAQSVASLGLGAYGLSNLIGGKAGGGLIKGYKRGGGVKESHYALGGGIMGGLTPKQLNDQAKKGGLTGLLAQQQMMTNQQMQVAQPASPAAMLPPEANTAGIPALPAPNMEQMAEGGIVGYADGGGVKHFQQGLTVPASTADGDWFWDVTNSIWSRVGGGGESNRSPATPPSPSDTGAFYGNPLIARQSKAARERVAQQAMYRAFASETNRRGLETGDTGYVPRGELPSPAMQPIKPALLGSPPQVKKGLDAIKTEATQPQPPPAQFPVPATPTEIPVPVVERPKSAADLYTGQKGLIEMLRKDDPMYAKLETLAAETAEFKDSRKYRAALNAAAALAAPGGVPQRGLLGLTKGIGPAGASVVADDAEIRKMNKEQFGIEAALRAANLQQAAHLGDREQKGQEAYDKGQRDVWEQRTKIQGEMYGYNIGAASREQVAKIGAEASIKAAQLHLQGVMAKVATDAKLGNDFKGMQLREKALNSSLADARKMIEGNAKLNLTVGSPEFITAVNTLAADLFPAHIAAHTSGNTEGVVAALRGIGRAQFGATEGAIRK